MKNEYVYSAFCTNVVDGDTIDCNIDLGFRVFSVHRLRLLGIDCPELNSKDEGERELAKIAKREVESLVLDKEITIRSYKSDSFGRWLADVYVNGTHLNEYLVKMGMAEVYKK